MGIVEDRSDLRYYAYGSDSGGGDTRELLLYLYGRFGPVSSFTGTYQADRWNLNINRRSPNSSECLKLDVKVTNLNHNFYTDCLSAPFQVPSMLFYISVLWLFT